jgi:hypothetical protein
VERDKDKLYEWALNAPDIRNAPKARDLLKCLFENWGRPIQAGEVWTKALREKGSYHGFRVRERVSDLRKRLGKIAASTDSPVSLQVPNAGPKEGYRLIVGEKPRRGAADGFWDVHTRADDVLMVYAEPVFFFDPEAASYIRYFDVNPRGGDAESSIAELEAKPVRSCASYMAGVI